jgi:hypothetical protein
MDEWLAKQVEAKAQDRMRELIDDALAECELSITVQTWLEPEKHHENRRLPMRITDL